MAVTSSGQVTINNIVTEFGGTAPHQMSEYYRNGSNVPGNNTNVPTSGEIKLSNFYGAVNEIIYTVGSGNTANLVVGSGIFGANWTASVPKKVIIPSGSNVVASSGYALQIDSGASGTLTIINNGAVYAYGGSYGAGGSGAAASAAGACSNGSSAGNGGHAIAVNLANVVITNNGTIAGGGGGGGGGGKSSYNVFFSFGGWVAGGSGGNGGNGAGWGQSQSNGSSGSAGGSYGISGGSGGSGGNGGTWGSSGSGGSSGSNGSQTNGCSGGNGASAGKAVHNIGSGSWTVTNNGTIYGTY